MLVRYLIWFSLGVVAQIPTKGVATCSANRRDMKCTAKAQPLRPAPVFPAYGWPLRCLDNPRRMSAYYMYWRRQNGKLREGQGPSKEDCVVRRKETTAAAFPSVNLTIAFIPPQNLATKPRRLRDLPPEIQVDRSTRVIKKLGASREASDERTGILPPGERARRSMERTF